MARFRVGNPAQIGDGPAAVTGDENGRFGLFGASRTFGFKHELRSCLAENPKPKLKPLTWPHRGNAPPQIRVDAIIAVGKGSVPPLLWLGRRRK